jgi:hypothetical protein
MRFKDSALCINFPHTEKNLGYGDFYFCDKFVIVEIANEIHVDWTALQRIANYILNFYGNSKKIGYISNKVNSYSIDPTIWIKFDEEYDFIAGAAIICYTKIDYINATIEKSFSRKNLKPYESLETAVNWINTLEGLN